MKSATNKSFLFASAALGLMFSLYQPATAMADDTTPQNPTQQPQPAPQPTPHHHHHHHHDDCGRGRKAFRLGLCTGQALAGQGIMLPMPAQGEHPKLDDATKTALRAAAKKCRDAYEAADSDEVSDTFDSIDSTDSDEGADTSGGSSQVYQ